MMKSLLLSVLIFPCFSCERKTSNEGQIQIQLPGTQPQIASVGTFATVGSGTIEEFDQDLSSQVISGARPINCYFVALAATSDESEFKANYCGTRNASLARTERNYEFGPAEGFVASGGTIEITSKAAENRIVYVFGLHAKNPAACTKLQRDLKSQPSKSNFSFPFIIGKSDLFSIKSGTTTVVRVTLNQPAAANEMYDCILPSFNRTELPIANRIQVSRDSYLPNILVTRQGLYAATYRCDYVDMILKSFQADGTSLNPARLPTNETFEILYNGTVINTSSTKFACEAAVPTDSSFVATPFNLKVRRWFALYGSEEGTTRSVQIRSLTDPAKTSSKAFGILSTYVAGATLSVGGQGVRTKHVIDLPDTVYAGVCYPIIFSRKTLELHYPTALEDIAAIVSPPAAVSFFSNSTCTVPFISPMHIPSTDWYVVYYFTSSSSFQIYSQSLSALSPLPIPSEPKDVVVKADVAATNEIEKVEIDMPILIGISADFSCYPLQIRFKDSKGVVVPFPSGSSVKILTDEMDSAAWTNISAFNGPTNSNCETGAPDLGNSTVTLNSTYGAHKLYLKIPLSVNLGRKKIKLKIFDGVKTYFIDREFEVNRRNGS